MNLLVFSLTPCLVYWVLGGIFYLMEQTPWCAMYRVQPRPVPKDVRDNTVTLRQVLLAVFVQHILQVLISICAGLVLGEQPEDPLWLCAVKLPLAMVVLDTWEFWLHYIMHHNNTMFRMLHSWHHRLYAPYGWGALYNHPIEGFLLDTVGTAFAMFAVFLDEKTALVLMCLATAKTVSDHSNFYIPWSPLCFPFANNAKYHGFHHDPKGFRKNLQQPFFTFWDDFLGFAEHHQISHD